ncbi:MAG: ATP-dependent DNA ligase, partial [Peptococcaceae bacterium]|nr:ATP-dependent DNA ligase [Peptococcaceae bacterium]
MTPDILPLVRPMLAVSAEPFDSAEHLFEVKWDGYRGLAYLNGGTVLRSRNLLDLTGMFPELAGLHGKVKELPAILDGEIVALENGRPSFAALQSRGRTGGLKGAACAPAGGPAVFIAFDILYSGGRSVMKMPLAERKRLLEETVEPGEEVILSRYVLRNGRAFYDLCVERGLEGVVAKRLDSIYLPGRRSSHWLKFRHTREADLVICGYQG